jgi:hypothetical protein
MPYQAGIKSLSKAAYHFLKNVSDGLLRVTLDHFCVQI